MMLAFGNSVRGNKYREYASDSILAPISRSKRSRIFWKNFIIEWLLVLVIVFRNYNIYMNIGNVRMSPMCSDHLLFLAGLKLCD